MRKTPTAGLELPADLTERTSGFTGREWVFEKLDGWLSADGPRTFLLTGGPGTGKSAIAARLVQMSRTETSSEGYLRLGEGALTYAHFCRAREDLTLDPLRFLEALAGTLAGRHEPFRQVLTKDDHEQITVNVETITQEVRGGVMAGALVAGVVIRVGELAARVAFNRLIRRPLEALVESGFHEPIVVLVDALDEALTYSSEDTLVSLLGAITDRPTDLPEPISLVLTSRPDPRVLSSITEPTTLDLLSDAPTDIDEVRDYAYRRLSPLPEPERAEVARRVADAGSGNFLHARYVVDDLLRRPEQTRDLSTLVLPRGLEEHYREFLDRLARSRERWEERYRPLLGTLAVGRGDGLTAEQLAEITDLPRSRTDDALQACAQYLSGPEPEGPFRLYHQSFRDFLLENKQHRVYPEEANEAVARYFLDEYEDDWAKCGDRYALEHTPAHLLEPLKEAGGGKVRRSLVEMLTELLTDLGFLESKTATFGIDAVLSDLRTATRLSPASNDVLLPVLRTMTLEVNSLRPWEPDRFRAYFAQQIRNRAADLGIRSLMDTAQRRLDSLREPRFELLWLARRESSALERTLTGHAEWVGAVAITPDGRRAVSGYDDHTLKVWDLDTGEDLRTLAGHESTVLAVAITPDGRRAVSGSIDNTLKVWDLDPGEDLRTLAGHEAAVRAVAITPDGRRAVSGSDDSTQKVWDLDTGANLLTHEGRVGLAVAITPDGRRAVSGLIDNTLKVWELDSGEDLLTLAGHEDWVTAVAITPDGRLAVSGSDDSTLKGWDLGTGEDLGTLAGHEAAVEAVAITPDGRRAVSASLDTTLKVWDLDTGEDLRTLAGHEAAVEAVAITSDGRRAVSGSTDNTLRVWDLETAEPIAMASLPAEVASLALDESIVCVGDSAGGFHCFRFVEAAPPRARAG